MINVFSAISASYIFVANLTYVLELYEIVLYFISRGVTRFNYFPNADKIANNESCFASGTLSR